MMKPKQKLNPGFTLMELLIALAIIALLAGIVGPMIFSSLGDSKRIVARAQIRNYEDALNTYLKDLDSYPTPQEGLEALLENPSNDPRWKGPYLEKSTSFLDPWDHKYQYRLNEQWGFEIISFGKDGKLGGIHEDQDIISWKSE